MQLMLDIETLGVTPGDIILSVAAVPFHLDGAYPGVGAYTHAISVKNSESWGLTENPETRAWWNDQDEHARRKAFSGIMPLPNVLTELSDFVKQYGFEGIWAKGPHFDHVMVEAACRIVKVPAPWNHRVHRDVRTIMEISGVTEWPEFEGTPHDPFWDCVHQIRCVQKAYEALRPLGELTIAKP